MSSEGQAHCHTGVPWTPLPRPPGGPSHRESSRLVPTPRAMRPEVKHLPLYSWIPEPERDSSTPSSHSPLGPCPLHFPSCPPPSPGGEDRSSVSLIFPILHLDISFGTQKPRIFMSLLSGSFEMTLHPHLCSGTVLVRSP